MNWRCHRSSLFAAPIIAALVLAFAGPRPAAAQSFNPRRMAMGGVILPSGGASSSGANIAYRGVPKAKRDPRGVPLPLGIIPVLAHPPQLDPKKPDFNVYEIANLLTNIPWNLQITSPPTPSNDITVSIGQNQLAVELGDLANVFPKDHSRVGTVLNGPSAAIGFRNAFVGLQPLISYTNDLTFNPALRHVLVDGADVNTQTDYAAFDNVMAQAAAGLQFGWSGPVAMRGDDPHDPGSSAIYLGARIKVLRGLAYGSADNVAAFTTSDSLFGSNPVDVRYNGNLRQAGPSNGRWGQGFDLGLVYFRRGIEVGVGLNDVATRLKWKVKESVAYTDTVTNNIVQRTLREGADFTSKVPTTVSVNAATNFGRFLVAADVERGVFTTTGHVGGETWWRMLALRAGAGLDPDRSLQFGGGTGVRMGRIGVDLALASHSRNLSHERALEFGAGLTFYPSETP